MMKTYRKNKDKWYSRNVTNKVINGKGHYRKYPIKDKFCKSCGSKDDLEVHHEIYPTNVKEIKKAIDKGLIYYKCRKCHGRRDSHKVNSKKPKSI